MPKISVIIPVYGVERFIERCTNSLFSQTLDDIEFIFIDDCTPDNSMSIIRNQIERYRTLIKKNNWFIRLEKMPINSGQSAVRKYGISLATGDYVIHCDSDDWVSPNMYKLMYEKAIEECADAVVCDYNITDGERVLRTIRGGRFTDKERFIEQILFQSAPWSLWNKMFKRTSCYKADMIYPKGNMGEDFVLTTQLLLNSNKIAYVSQPFYNYFYNPASITRVVTEEKKMDNFKMNKANADIVYDILNTRGLGDRYSLALVSSKWYIKKLLWNTDFDSKKRQLWKDTYKEINNRIITNSHISMKDKIKFILTYLCLFPKQVLKVIL